MSLEKRSSKRPRILVTEIGGPGRTCSLLIARQKTSKSLYYATEQPTCKNVACIKIREFPYFCSKKPEERNADKAPLSGTVRHEMHLQFSITSRHALPRKTSLDYFRSMNRICSRCIRKNQFNSMHKCYFGYNNFQQSTFFNTFFAALGRSRFYSVNP